VKIKMNIFWILISTVVLAGVGLWAWTVPPLWTKNEQTWKECQDKATALQKLAAQAGKGDEIKTPQHVKMAKEYGKKVEDQLEGLHKDLEGKKLDLRFENVPTDSGRFDIWLSELRQKISEQAAKAGLQMPPDVEKLMFKEPATDDYAQKVEQHRSYRMRQMACVEEVVDILCRKYGKQQVLKFQPEKDIPEAQEQVDAGALVLEHLAMTSPKSIYPAATTVVTGSAGGKMATATSVATTEGREQAIMEGALRRSGTRMTLAPHLGATVATGLPYSITSLDIQFVAPLPVVPVIAQALETSTRWTAVVSRLEYERSTAPYPAAPELKSAKAGPLPGMNTHYQEAPVRALVSLDLYEYDEAKAKATPAAPPPPTKKSDKKMDKKSEKQSEKK